jgi:hypothetical protein
MCATLIKFSREFCDRMFCVAAPSLVCLFGRKEYNRTLEERTHRNNALAQIGTHFGADSFARKKLGLIDKTETKKILT